MAHKYKGGPLDLEVLRFGVAELSIPLTKEYSLELIALAAKMQALLKAQLRQVRGPLDAVMWEAPDGSGGQFSDPDVALHCWIASTPTAI